MTSTVTMTNYREKSDYSKNRIELQFLGLLKLMTVWNLQLGADSHTLQRNTNDKEKKGKEEIDVDN